jgi:hypothetical protein
MAMIRCSQGHFYDSEKNSSCPWCGVPGMASSPSPSGGDSLKTVPGRKDQDADFQTARLDEGTAAIPQEGHTIAIVKKKTGLDPVVGWLVCVEGIEKGKDYRLHSEKNMAGRSDSMDIVVKDPTISRENHAFFVFDPKGKTFLVQEGDGRGLVYVNGSQVIGSRVLVPHDRIEMGESAFLFVPFCGEKFSWENGGGSNNEDDK